MTLRIATAVSFLCLLASCWPGPLVGPRIEEPLAATDGAGPGVPFQELLAEVIVPSCAESFCHKNNPPPAAPMTLEPDLAFAQLVNVPASQEPSLMRVLPGDPANSYLLIKLRAHSSQELGTTQMPLNKPQLDEQSVLAIESWIARGAPND